MTKGTRLLDWTKTKPSEVGTYQRKNPPAKALVRLDVVLDFACELSYVDSTTGNLKPVGELPDGFWYFGPIPELPEWVSER